MLLREASASCWQHRSVRRGLVQPCTHAGPAAGVGLWPRQRCITVRSSSSDSETGSTGSTAQAEPPAPSSAHSAPAAPSPPQQQEQPPKRVEKAISLLDSLLGDAALPPSGKASTVSSTNSGSSSSSTPPSATGDSLQRLAQSEAQRLANDPSKTGPLREDMEIQFQKIVEKARKLADEQGATGSADTQAGQEQLRKEFETLLETISKGPQTLDKDDIKKLKAAAFGPQTFYVTETLPLTDNERTGLLIRGNLREERTKVFQYVQQKVTELFGDKYSVLMVEDEQVNEDDSNPMSASGPRASGAAGRAKELNTPRVAFQVVPAAQAIPPQTNGWKQAIAFALALFFIASCGQLALAANITKLPKETLEWFANPANFESDQLPAGLESWDPLPYFQTAVPIFSAVLGVNVIHEVARRLAAAAKGVKLGPTFFIPNFQIGSFGAITPFTSMVKDRATLWDVAAAGPLAGVLMSATLLGLGYLQSQPGAMPPEALVPVPTQLFQGSLLLGTITRTVLGEGALGQAEVSVSPLVIAGWCGLITQALQLLPVGSVDGGRMVQAAYGRNSLALSSFFTYVGLGLGLLGSNLALPYGLYVLICQRTAEKYISDGVTPAGDTRAYATAVALLVALLVLVPMAPELAQELGVGPGSGAMFF